MTALFGRCRVAFNLVLLLSLAGCSLSGGVDMLQEPTPRFGRDRMPAGTWDEASADFAAGESGWTARLWLLPLWVSGQRTAVADDAESTSVSTLSALNPGFIVLPWLPLWISTDTEQVRRSGERATSSMTWTPIFIHNEEIGWSREEPALRAWGWPLLYSRLTYGPADGENAFEMHNVLWTLGPSWASLDLEIDDKFARGWGFTPLALAGLGTLLWTSGEIESTDEMMTVHGPLQGYLGYRSVVDHEDDEFSRRIVSGILWYDSANAADPDDASDTRHGPLWSMFGWGRSEGEPAMYLFWFPIAM